MTLKQHLDIEFYKLNRPDYYIFLGILILSLVAFPISIASKSSDMFTLSALFSMVKRVGTMAIIFGTIVALSREFTNGTNRKRIVNGYSRNDLFISQLVIMFYYIATVLVLAALTSVVLIATHGGKVFAGTAFPFSQLIALVVALLSYGVIGASTGVITTKAHRAILLFLGLGVMEMVFNMMSINYSFLQFFTPLGTIGNLMNPELLYTWHYIVLVVFLVGLLGGSFLKLKRADF